MVTTAGIEVAHIATGQRGVTTSDKKRGGLIGVMWIGGLYPVLEDVDDLEPVQ